jgi:hypothetical protein
MANVLSACQVSSGNDIRGSHGKKNNQHSKKDCFFCHEFPECHSLMKLGKNLKHLPFFAKKFIFEFFDFFLILLFMVV